MGADAERRSRRRSDPPSCWLKGPRSFSVHARGVPGLTSNDLLQGDALAPGAVANPVCREARRHAGVANQPGPPLSNSAKSRTARRPPGVDHHLAKRVEVAVGKGAAPCLRAATACRRPFPTGVCRPAPQFREALVRRGLVGPPSGKSLWLSRTPKGSVRIASLLGRGSENAA